MKKLLCVVLGIVLLIAAGGCGTSTGQDSSEQSSAAQSQQPDSPSPQSSQTEAATLVRWLTEASSEVEISQWREIASDVSVRFPDVVVELSTTDWDSYWTKLPTEIAGGNPPDILYMQVMRAKSFMKGGFEPLNDYLDADPDIDLQDFYDGVLEGLSDEGKIYCLPYDFGPWISFYNMDLFDKYGVPYPDEEFSYDTYMKICEELAKDGNYGPVIMADIDRLIPFIWSEGVTFYDASGKFVINDPVIVAAVQRQADMIRNGLAPLQTDTGNYNWNREQFYSGTIGMLIDGPWHTYGIKNNGNFRFGASVVPAGSVSRATPVAGSGFGISSGSKNKEAAYKALSVITGKESQAKLAEWGRALPARESVRDIYYEMNSDVPGLKEAVENSCKPGVGAPYITPDHWQEINNTINQNIEPVLLGNMDAQSALDNAQSIIDEILGQ